MPELPRQLRLSYPNKLKRCIELSWVCWLGLVLVIAIKWWLDRISLTLFIMQSVPLLIVLPGLWLHVFRAYSWLCFIVLLYFIPGVTGVMAPDVYWTDWVQFLLSFTLFFSAAFASRWLQQVQYHASNPTTDSPAEDQV